MKNEITDDKDDERWKEHYRKLGWLWTSKEKI